MVKHLRLTTVLTSFLMLGAGYILMMKPRTSIKMICTAIAVCFLVVAITRLIAYMRVKKENGIAAAGELMLTIILGIGAVMFFMHPFSITQIIPLTLGIIILANGLLLVVTGIMYRSLLPKKGIISIVIGIICILLGWYATTNPFATQVMFMRYIGAAFIISGISNLFNQVVAEVSELRNKKNTANEVKDVEYTTEPNK